MARGHMTQKTGPVQQLLAVLLVVSTLRLAETALESSAAIEWNNVDNIADRRLLAALLSGSRGTATPQTVGFGDVKIARPVPLPPVVANARRAADLQPGQQHNPFVTTNERTAAANPPMVSQLSICNGIRICSGTVPIQLRGINWFGFEITATMVDGLWQGPTSLTLDFITVLRRIKLLGFNTIRLPFSLKMLFDGLPRDFSRNCPDGGAQNPNITQLLNSVLPPGYVAPSTGSASLTYAPLGKIATDGSPAVCNSYLPNDSVLSRFLWVVGVLARNNFVIIIDQHLNTDTTLIEDQGLWLTRWLTVVQEINKDPYSQRRVIFDVLNEPDSFGLRWENSTIPSKPSMTSVYLNFMDAAHAVNPNFLFAIQGLGQGSIGANWGDGLATDPAVLVNTAASDPNPFFRALLKKTYRRNVVIAPHVYPPSISLQSNNALNLAPGYFRRLSNSFGYLNKKGYCYNGDCQLFPVMLGEFGSRLRDCRNRCALPGANCMEVELQNLNLLNDYINNVGAAADGNHSSIDSWAWWAWNANSGDTGGLVDDDWSTVIWQKVDYLGRVGLNPWYTSKCGSSCFKPLLDTYPDGGCGALCSPSAPCPIGYNCISGQCCSAVSTCNLNQCCLGTAVCRNNACCPQTQLCGTGCCTSDQVCLAGTCIAKSATRTCGAALCPKERACGYAAGGSCCAPEKSCSTSTCCGGARTCAYDKALKKSVCCDPIKKCGTNCCSSTQTCNNGACCTTSRVCGKACCAYGKTCLNGACCNTQKVCGKHCCPSGYSCLKPSLTCCPLARKCGTNVCCKAGTKCSNGKCVVA